MESRLLDEVTDERLRIHGSNRGGIERLTQSLLEQIGRPEGPFHLHLLVEQHPERERKRALGEQLIGVGVSGPGQ